MDAERLEIARRSSSARPWVWFDGMMACRWSGERVGRITVDARGVASCGAVIVGKDFVPDLDDLLTRLGVITIMRLACSSGGMHRKTRFLAGTTEEAALLAAMDVAP